MRMVEFCHLDCGVSSAKEKQQRLKFCDRSLVKERTPVPESIFIGTRCLACGWVKLEAILLSLTDRPLQRDRLERYEKKNEPSVLVPH